MRILAGCIVLAAFASSCRSTPSHSGSLEPFRYTNPVITQVAADPGVIRAQDGIFYLYATNDDWGDGQGLRIVPIFSSPDLVNWTYQGTAFAEKPDWKAEGGLWAPDISYHDGRYYLYYAYSTWGDPDPCIGLATATLPTGPWTDLGKPVFCSRTIGVENSIDPFVWKESDERTLVWGSFHGIYAVGVSGDGGQAVGEKLKLADERFEAPWIHHRNGYYYLFLSVGTCCEGAESTYRVYVGRSENLLGPYVDADGRDVREGGGTLVLAGDERWAGPGHNSIVTDDAGTDWIVYHAMPKNDARLSNDTNRRVVLIDPLVWSDAGWPTVAGQAPSRSPRPSPVLHGPVR